MGLRDQRARHGRLGRRLGQILDDFDRLGPPDPDDGGFALASLLASWGR